MPKIKRIARKYEYYIGIDAGTNTGIAIWHSKKKEFNLIQTMKIHMALHTVERWILQDVLVRVEDARLATWKRSGDAYKAKGAGSVMRDAAIWEDFLEDIGVDYEMVRPRKQITKWKEDDFKRFTKYQGRTSEHGRDSALIVFGL